MSKTFRRISPGLMATGLVVSLAIASPAIAHPRYPVRAHVASVEVGDCVLHAYNPTYLRYAYYPYPYDGNVIAQGRIDQCGVGYIVDNSRWEICLRSSYSPSGPWTTDGGTCRSGTVSGNPSYVPIDSNEQYAPCHVWFQTWDWFREGPAGAPSGAYNSSPNYRC